MNMSNPSIPNAFGTTTGAGPRNSLVELSRHTAHDTIVIATAITARKALADRSELNLTFEDVDGLSKVVEPLEGPHLDLVLHGAGGDLDAAAEAIALLHGRFDVIRALVPRCALSTMALIACACDAVMMPDSAVIGPSDDAHHAPVSAETASRWLSHHCEHPDRGDRVRGVATAFAASHGPRAPLPARLAKVRGLPVNIVPEQSALGCSLENIWSDVEHTLRERSLVRLIECQKKPTYWVEG